MHSTYNKAIRFAAFYSIFLEIFHVWITARKILFLMYKKLGIVERVEELLDVIMLFVLTLLS